VRVYTEELNRVLQKKLDTYIFPFRVEEVKRGGLYHLIHISHHPRARQVMDIAVSVAGATKRDASKKEIQEVGLKLKIQDAKPIDVAGEAIVSLLQQKRGPVPVLDVAAYLWRRNEFMTLRWRDFEATVMWLSQKGLVGRPCALLVNEAICLSRACGISFHSLPSSLRPPDFGEYPPHCLKKKATPCSSA